MEATRGHSLDNLNKAALKEEMTGRWLEGKGYIQTLFSFKNFLLL